MAWAVYPRQRHVLERVIKAVLFHSSPALNGNESARLFDEGFSTAQERRGYIYDSPLRLNPHTLTVKQCACKASSGRERKSRGGGVKHTSIPVKHADNTR